MEGFWAANLAVGASVVLAGISALLAFIGFLSYARLRHGRLVWVGLAFTGFAAEGGLLAWWSYQQRVELAAGNSPELLVLAVVNLAIVLALYLAVLKR